MHKRRQSSVNACKTNKTKRLTTRSINVKQTDRVQASLATEGIVC